MFKINSYTDLKVAYEILEIAYESGRSQKAANERMAISFRARNALEDFEAQEW